MHTATQLDSSLFGLKIDGVPATRDELLPEWCAHDRLGVIVDEPFGATGASLLIQLAITAFYDVRLNRRDGPLYPEVYLFHLGRPHGDHAYYDVFPRRKELVVPDDPATILEAINDRAITRLLVVDRPPQPVRHHWKEPISARDRIRSAFAYAPDGRTREPDVEIEALHDRAVANTRMTLQPTRTYAEQARIRAELGAATVVPEDEEMLPRESRLEEVSAADRDRIAERRSAISVNGLPRETYRRIAVSDALRMLGSGSAADR